VSVNEKAVGGPTITRSLPPLAHNARGSGPSALLCTVDQTAGNGGIARVSILLSEVMRRSSPDGCRTLTLFPPGEAAATYFDKARFSARLMSGQLRREFQWLFFDHVLLAVIQPFVPRRYRSPYAIFLHSVEVWNHLSAPRLRTLQGATVLVANSEYTATRVRAAHPDLGPIHVCPLALPPQSRNTATRAGLSKTELLQRIRTNAVAIVGRLSSVERHKGHLQLIHSWPAVRQRVPDAQLVIVGKGDDLPYLRSKVRDAGCQDAVLFTGWVDDDTLAAIYDHVAVYAMPSDGEGFGLVFLEAMKHRLPCIASSTDASREIVVDGTTGFLVTQNDERALTERIVQLLENPALRCRLGEAGFRLLNDSFSFELFEERLLSALQPLLNARNRSQQEIA
jgi:phosphatidylinositol alpha-1,6-mannosyltransferase